MGQGYWPATLDEAMHLAEVYFVAAPDLGVLGLSHSVSLLPSSPRIPAPPDLVPTTTLLPCLTNVSPRVVFLFTGGISRTHHSWDKARAGVLVLRGSREFPGSVFWHEGLSLWCIQTSVHQSLIQCMALRSAHLVKVRCVHRDIQDYPLMPSFIKFLWKKSQSGG